MWSLRGLSIEVPRVPTSSLGSHFSWATATATGSPMVYLQVTSPPDFTYISLS